MDGFAPLDSMVETADNAVGPQAKLSELLTQREAHLGKALSIAHGKPLHITHGIGQYLFASDGTRYLDLVNNVSHVGHSNPRVTEACAKQMRLLNTTTR